MTNDHQRCSLMNLSSCYSTSLLRSWWAMNSIRHDASSGTELELFMPNAEQHQLKNQFKNNFTITLNQSNTVVYSMQPRSISHLFLIIMPQLLVVNVLLKTVTRCGN